MLSASVLTFSGPSLSDLIALARQGEDTSVAGINRMVQALESQLTSGPLADLNAGTVDSSGFVTEVQSLVASYAQNVDSQLLPDFPNIDTLLNLQGERIVADETSLNQQTSVGLLSSSEFATQAQTAINSLTDGPLFSLQTPLSGYATATENFESGLNALAESLGSSATTPLTPAQVSATVLAEAVAYQADIHAALQVTHPNISNTVDQAILELGTAANSIATETSSVAQTDLQSAISTFDTAILGSNGVFGPKGVIAVALTSGEGFSPQLTDTRPAPGLGSVSGAVSAGGTATLTATLASSDGTSISGVPVAFSLDGAFAGVALTNTAGVATLANVSTSDVAGTDKGGVLAYFAGSIKYKSSAGSGDLTVSPSATSLGTVSGSASFGGTATLTATLTSSVTNAAISGETLDFTLDGVAVGSATTSSSGVATLTGVVTTDAAGTHPGAVVASFAGDTNYAAAANGTGDLTVTQAATSIASISGNCHGRRGLALGDHHLDGDGTTDFRSQPQLHLGRHGCGLGNNRQQRCRDVGECPDERPCGHLSHCGGCGVRRRKQLYQ